VTVTDGLFNVAIGDASDGVVQDGPDGAGPGSCGAGCYNSFAAAFRDFGTLYLEVEIDGETLNPRTRVSSAGYSLNADNLDGQDSTFFIDTSGTAQTKTGLLTASGGVDFGAGSDDDLTAADVTTLTDGLSSADALHTHASVGDADTLDGNDSTFFLDTSFNPQTKMGNLTVANMTLSGDSLFFNGGSRFVSTVNELNIFTGDSDNDDLYLQAGNDASDGRIAIIGDAEMLLQAGNGNFDYYRGDGVQIADLNSAGTLQLDGDADIDGGDLFLGTGGSMSNSGTIFTLQAGDLNTDDLYLQAGNDVSDGAIQIFGDASFEMRSGDGLFRFINGTTGFQTAYLNSSGDLGIDGDADIDGSDLFLGVGASMNNTGSVFTLQAGDSNSDSLYLLAGNDITDGGVQFFGSASARIYSGNGIWDFYNGVGSTLVLRVGDTGDIEVGRNTGTDDDSIFFDANVEDLTWDESQTRFEFSDELAVSGPIRAGSTTLAPVGYNTLSSGNGPDSGNISNTGDLFLANDLEVGVGLFLSKAIYMEGSSAAGADGDQNIYFYDDDSRTSNYIRWDNVRADAACSGTGATTEGMVFNIPDFPTREAFLFTNGTDVEFKIDDTGNAALDASLTQSGSCDVAEGFLGPDLPAGTVVVLDPALPEAVIASSAAYQAAVGVVSTRPGVLLSGPTADSYPVWKEMVSLQEQIDLLAATDSTHAADLDVRRQQLESELDAWTRGNVAVALVGRVPVKVDASRGAIHQGDYLTSSHTPGHAMALDQPGPYFGIAMEGFTGGQGEILVFLAQGWYGGPPEGGATTDDAEASAPAEQIAEVQRMDSNLQILLDRDANDQSRFSISRDGEDGLSSEVFRVDEEGNVFARGSFRPSAMDIAEYHPVGEPVAVGDILVADRDNPGTLRLGREASDPAVVGIVSSEPGMLLGSGMTRIAAADPELASQLEEARTFGDTEEEARLWKALEAKFRQTHAPIALTGTVPAKVDAGYGAVQVGDLLTVSPTAGHAMRAVDPKPGTILGKALEPLSEGTGLIQVLVMLR
jgi:hypothetical protein